MNLPLLPFKETEEWKKIRIVNGDAVEVADMWVRVIDSVAHIHGGSYDGLCVDVLGDLLTLNKDTGETTLHTPDIPEEQKDYVYQCIVEGEDFVETTFYVLGSELERVGVRHERLD